MVISVEDMVIMLKYNYGDDNCRIYDNVDNSEKLGKVVSKPFLRFCIFLGTSSPTIFVIVAVAAAIVLIVLVVIIVIYKNRKQTSNLPNASETVDTWSTTIARPSQNNQVCVS